MALAHIIYVILVHVLQYFKFPAKSTGRYHGNYTAHGRYLMTEQEQEDHRLIRENQCQADAWRARIC